ncbi:MAG TPA: DUF3761 domain-containing protein [Casimicrobiaceae bacterium]|jgi:hypothetical protein
MRTKLLTLPIVLAAGLALTSLAFAQAPAQAPAGSTGACKDGSYTSQAKKRGACKGHGGVKEWYASEAKSKDKASSAATAEKTAKESKAATKESKKQSKKEKAAEAAAAGGATGAAAGAATPAPAQTSSMASSHKTTKGMRAEAAPGGGAGKVWVNTATHTYHCNGDQWYGKTKEGEYMTEAEAKAKGAHASHGKACS